MSLGYGRINELTHVGRILCIVRAVLTFAFALSTGASCPGRTTGTTRIEQNAIRVTQNHTSPRR